MDINIVSAAFFSPTGGSATLARRLAASLVGMLGAQARYLDFTTPGRRETPLSFEPGTLALVAVPVYAGRVPNVLLPFLRQTAGPGALAVPLVLYGNRAFDDALIELRDLLEAGGLRTVAAGAFVGQHSFSTRLAANRPDKADLKQADALAQALCQKLDSMSQPPERPITVPGNSPPAPYYVPRYADGKPVDMLKLKPSVTEACIGCGLCAGLCPMGSIDFSQPQRTTGICIKCNACIRGCPQRARRFDGKGYQYHLRDLEQRFGRRQEPVFFV